MGWKDSVGSMSGESESEARDREQKELEALRAKFAEEDRKANEEKNKK